MARLPSGRGPGRPRVIDADDDRFLVDTLNTEPRLSTYELAEKMRARKGRRVSHDAINNALKRLGLKRVRTENAPSTPPAKRYGYTQAHRRPSGGHYPSSTTDVEWELVRHLFERSGAGRPEKYPRRLVFDAICYAVRSGCAWRMLPREFPPWQNVYATFRRWSDERLFEKMNDDLRKLWREREGRDEAPTASVLDSQSVRTAEKGGPMVTMAPRRSKAASAIS
jgi:transposase